MDALNWKNGIEITEKKTHLTDTAMVNNYREKQNVIC